MEGEGETPEPADFPLATVSAASAPEVAGDGATLEEGQRWGWDLVLPRRQGAGCLAATRGVCSNPCAAVLLAPIDLAEPALGNRVHTNQARTNQAWIK